MERFAISAMPKTDRPERSPDLDLLHERADRGLLAHRIGHAGVQAMLNDRARRGEVSPVSSEHHASPLEARYATSHRSGLRVIEAANLWTSGDWADCRDLELSGERESAALLHLLVALEKDLLFVPFRQLIVDSQIFHEVCATEEDRDMAFIWSLLRTHLRAMERHAFRRAVLFFPLIEVANSGVCIWRDANGHQQVTPYVPSGAERAS